VAPLVKWFLAIPHYIVLLFLDIAGIVVVIIAWRAILFTGRYPRGMFDFIEGLIRWHNRVIAYALVLVTDRYPPFNFAAMSSAQAIVGGRARGRRLAVGAYRRGHEGLRRSGRLRSLMSRRACRALSWQIERERARCRIHSFSPERLCADLNRVGGAALVSRSS